MLEMGMTFDYAKLVMDNEFAYMIKHAVKGIPVDAENLAVDIIREIGPGGEFVSNIHTYQHFKEAQSRSVLIDRRMPEDWVTMGSKDILQKANEIAIDLYDNYKPTPLSIDVQKQIREIVNGAEKHYGIELSVK